MMSCVPILIYLHPREINSRLNIRYFLQTLITHHFYLSHSVDTRSSVVDCNFHSLNTTIRLSISVKHARQRICQILRIFRGLLNERARRPINWVLILEKFQDIMEKYRDKYRVVSSENLIEKIWKVEWQVGATPQLSRPFRPRFL